MCRSHNRSQWWEYPKLVTESGGSWVDAANGECHTLGF
jgi:hypothetical protein